MIHIKSLEDGLELFKALGSDIRVQIIRLLMENRQMSMNQLATELKITNGALTSHIKKLESVGLISTSSEAASHGNQKFCSVHADRILIEMDREPDTSNVYSTELRIGQYSAKSIMPTCGLSTGEKLIGEVDDPRYFDHPDRFNADILWFTKGFVEYSIPNLVPSAQEITEIAISCEICSEAPGVNDDWPSDISFIINDIPVAVWNSPGDFGDIKGLLTPDWWPQNWNQYGLLKLLVINKSGTFIDGLKKSDVTISDLRFNIREPIRFRLAVRQDAEHVGGLTIFGKSFGNYGQDILVTLKYRPRT